MSWMSDGWDKDGLYGPVVCIAHGEVVPCNKPGLCELTPERLAVEAVRKYQAGEIESW